MPKADENDLGFNESVQQIFNEIKAAADMY
jgi:hypothetical protein